MVPGEVLPKEGTIEINQGRDTTKVTVINLETAQYKLDHIFTSMKSIHR